MGYGISMGSTHYLTKINYHFRELDFISENSPQLLGLMLPLTLHKEALRKGNNTQKKFNII